MKINVPAVPDLLRRFVETPYAASFVSGDANVRIESNEMAIITEIHSAITLHNDLETEVSYWRLIRDEAAPCDGKELTILSSGPLSTLLLGTGTVIAVDHERGEVLGFLASDVSAEEFVRVLLPLVIRLSQQRLVTATPVAP
jgi:hypothetical protein